MLIYWTLNTLKHRYNFIMLHQGFPIKEWLMKWAINLKKLFLNGELTPLFKLAKGKM